MCKSSRIGILLIDTDLPKAKVFVERISKVLYNYFTPLAKDELTNFIDSISIASYPLNHMPGCVKIEGVPTIIHNISFERDIPAHNPQYKSSFKMHMNWRLQPTIDGAIALDSPILLDLNYENHIRALSRFAKRMVDIIGAIIGLVLLGIPMLGIALLIKFTSNGPILFRQRRAGYLGRMFTFRKFRTMECNTDDSIHKEYVSKLIKDELTGLNQGTDDEPVYKIVNDPRVTRIGRLLRKTSFDELPQFFNVLKGDMSLVGPRPPIPYEVDQYKQWHYRRLLEVKPGITGLWQVMGRDKARFNDIVRYDIQYIENWSLLLDFKIILKTFIVIFHFKGR
ncbi:sugar transferase [candidate division KSB1 bacterium]|nr:sugar transferase [candidate division KSB1 bacterium]